MAENKEDKTVCITPEQYQALIEMQKAVSAKQDCIQADLKDLKADIAIMKPAVEKTQVIVTGNGHPEEGMAHRVVTNENKLVSLEKKLDNYIQEQKEDKEKKEERTWGIVSPTITTIVLLVVTFILGGGLAFLIK